MAPPARTREDLLRAHLGELAGLWLAVTCAGCGRTTAWPFRILAARRGALRLSDLLPRLRCEHCKGRPSRASVKSFPASGPQYSDTWEVEVAP